MASVAVVRDVVPESTFKRAKEIVSSNKLHNTRFGPSLQISSAICLGSNSNDSYNVSVVVTSESPFKPVCQCSCPAAPKAKGNLCKHVVALLLLRVEEAKKIAKQQDDALAVSSPAREQAKESSLSDSQATEPFTCSEDAAKAHDSTTTAASAHQFAESNRKRFLPPWIWGEGALTEKKKDVKMNISRKKRVSAAELHDDEEDSDKKVKRHGKKTKLYGHDSNEDEDAEKTSKKDVEDEYKTSSVRPNVMSRRGNMALDERGNTGSFEADENLDGQKTYAKSRRGNKGKNGSNGLANTKRVGRKVKGYVESDLSEEDSPEVVNEGCISEQIDDDVLTSEDLVNMAKKHLELEKEQAREEANLAVKASIEIPINVKKKGSIYSLRGWNDIASDGSKPHNGSLGVHALGLQENDGNESIELSTGNIQARDGLCNENTLAHGPVEKLEPPENVMDDMLGLFFGPSLSKTIHCNESQKACLETRSGSGILLAEPQLTEDFNLPSGSGIMFHEQQITDVVLPTASDVVAKPKKKGSLKDQVMMFLG